MKKSVKKIVMYPDGATAKTREELNYVQDRVTIQLRAYDADGHYIKGDEYEGGNETIWLLGFSIDEAIEVVKSALFQSKHISRKFDVEK